MSHARSVSTVGQLDELLRGEEDITVAMLIQDAIRQLYAKGGASRSTPLRKHILEKLKTEVRPVFVPGGTENSFALVYLFATPSGSVDSAAPIAAARDYLATIRPVPDSTTFTVADLLPDSLGLIARVVANLGWTAERKLNPKALDELHSAVKTLAESHFRADGNLDETRPAEYGEETFYYFRERRDAMFEAELSELSAQLPAEQATSSASLVKRGVLLAHLWRENIDPLLLCTNRLAQGRLAANRIRQLYVELQDVTFTLGLDFHAIWTELDRGGEPLIYTPRDHV